MSMDMRKIAGGACALSLVLVSLAGQGAAAQPAGRPAPAAAGAAAASALLPSGYLGTRGSQIVDSTGKPVRIAAVALHGLLDRDQLAIVNQDAPLNGLAANMQAIRGAGFNTVTLAWNNASLHGSNASKYLAGLDAVVSAAKAELLKVILVHHNDEGVAGTNNCESQQSNGLWYDSGPGTDGTDGCGTKGTVTQASFLADWETLASRYSGNPTVIGMDLDNEPLAYAGDSTWGDGSVTDIRAMYTDVGNAVESRDPGVLIICEGPQNYGGSFAGGSGVKAFEGDLTLVKTKPVVLSSANGGAARVMYSVHEYPYEVAHIDPDAGAAAVARYNAVWGYLVSQDIAPVYIGEAGAGMASDDSKNWATWLTSYVNGQQGANGGPTFSGTEQGISVTWWVWDTQGLGTLNSDGTLNQDRKSVYSKWQLDVTP
ncbi:glycoside hydrolase family 5 protein [Streptomyces sp. TS71-3]|uniref:glycoside hydrolase family 5 protein n=1 Tax=Streptomyces sp. TS71-3 TaxID=2733862 RepID=UPI001B1FD829|nr:cellulase family glycosylhydrolase [Streptomyces sp. TS71-3]GHJ41694.1 hypothetical protein Sm713_73030 [Streptomyces sp. TS71-3]